MGGGSYGLCGTETGAHTTIVAPERAWTVFKGISGKPESFRSPIDNLSGFAPFDLPSCNTIFWTESKPGGETFFCAECLRIEARFGKNRVNSGNIQSIYFRKVHPGKPIEMGGSFGRYEATGQGCMFATQRFLSKALIPEQQEIAGARVVIQGFGDVGSVAAAAVAKRFSVGYTLAA